MNNSNNENAKLEEPIEEIEDIPESTLKAKAAKKIACILVVGYLLLISIPFFYLLIVTCITGANIDILTIVASQVIDMITMITAVLGGIIGAVITYYFTSENKI